MPHKKMDTARGVTRSYDAHAKQPISSSLEIMPFTTMNHTVPRRGQPCLDITWQVVNRVKPFAPSNKVCVDFAYRKNSRSLGLHHLQTKEAKFLDIVSIGKSFCLVTRLCQLMRSPLRTETPSLDKNNIG